MFQEVEPDARRNGFNFFFGVMALRVFTLLWLFWTVKKYFLLLQRPLELFWQHNFYLNWLMPELPGKMLFLSITALAAILNLLQLIRLRNSAWLQLPLALCLLWLNLPQWSYGFLSHVNHLFLLAHLFLIFIPLHKHSWRQPDQYTSKAINWFYAGLLFTYTLAGLWKIPSILYKLLTSSPDVHWLHPDGALYNAFVSFRSYDLPLHFTKLFTAVPLVWQASFILTVYVQSISVFAAFRQQLRPWVALFLILFHVVNMLAFQTHFVVAICVLLCLFLPYDLLLPALFRPKSLSGSPHIAATSLERQRNRLSQRHYYLSGILYLPGLRTLAQTLRPFQK
ncbi:hypothetical protein D1627_01890 [Pontibacter oryzae]|uniref:HTTM domain-containing protein n=2 Tax=Pontibacter oryzae TaxID=2304593 RepID=A0A399SKC8_9BACT|nr:hypothetical protein D1627_01890 [Pontibacter oryzae]